jgi:hypothetical protein
MRKCPACGQAFRTGTLAFMLEPGDGKRGGGRGLRGVIACSSCAKGGVLLVAPKLAPRKVEKVVRSDGVTRVLRMLRTYAKAAAVSGDDRKAEGLESAIQTVERELGGKVT